MTFVITQGCCDDASCVPVCPVQCIRPRPGDPEFSSTEQLYIDPATCIDCGACARACPVDAIHHHDALPSSVVDFRAINADYFTDHPLQEVTCPPILRRRLPSDSEHLTVAIVGAGPSGLYAAAELSEIPGVSVTVIERLPVPYGLVRAGVAPDHRHTKRIGERFGRVLRRPNVRCLFNVEVGRDVTVAELLDHHHALIWAAGASDDRKLGIPGEHLEGVVSAREFVSWYNGHPDFAEQRFNLAGKTAVVVGNGNVALDVARVLTQPIQAYERTSMSDLALGALRRSAIEEVLVVGRRGQVHAAYGTGELLALSRLAEVDLLALPTEVSVTEKELEALGSTARSVQFERRRAIIDAAARRTSAAARRIVMRYRMTPTELVGEDHVRRLVLTGPDGTEEAVETSLVIRAVGFRGRGTTGMPFDPSAGIVPNVAGRVVDPDTGDPLPGRYCVGWIKRGPTGVIGTNRADSAETVAALLSDFADHRLIKPRMSPERLARVVRARQPGLVDDAGWLRIEEAETAAGRASGRDRVQLLSIDEMVRVAHGGGIT